MKYVGRAMPLCVDDRAVAESEHASHLVAGPEWPEEVGQITFPHFRLPDSSGWPQSVHKHLRNRG